MGDIIHGVRYGEVISINDEAGGDRISVRVSAMDNESLVNGNGISVDAIPLMPKMFHVKPKVGEGVFVIYSVLNDDSSVKHYIGPVVSQLHRLSYEPYFKGGDTYQRGGPKGYDVNPNNGEALGAFPDDEDVAILGRKNCDIQIKDDDIRIRAGVRLSKDETDYRIVFNAKNPAYIKLKYHQQPLNGENQSTATIVADKVLLMSNKSREVMLEQANREELITDDEINKMLEEAYKLPYGEKLVKLLKTMIDVFCKHTHDYIAMPPNPVFIEEIKNAANEPLYQEKLLSNTVRIN